MRGKRLELAGTRSDTVLVTEKGSKPRYWKCRCEECGRVFQALGSRLKAGRIKCICQTPIRHGQAKRGDHSAPYKHWQYMKGRCKRDKSYAGFVSYDPRWESFQNFYSDMGDCPEGYSLDRKNPFEGYRKENCRWAPPDVQASNKRGARLLRYDWAFDGPQGKRSGGALAPVAEWAWYLRRMTGVEGWTTQRLLDTLRVLTLDQIIKAASPWSLPPEELAWMAGQDFSFMWEDHLRSVYLQAA